MGLNQRDILKTESVEIGALISMLRKQKKIKQKDLFEGLFVGSGFDRWRIRSFGME